MIKLFSYSFIFFVFMFKLNLLKKKFIRFSLIPIKLLIFKKKKLYTIELKLTIRPSFKASDKVVVLSTKKIKNKRR